MRKLATRQAAYMVKEWNFESATELLNGLNFESATELLKGLDFYLLVALLQIVKRKRYRP